MKIFSWGTTKKKRSKTSTEGCKKAYECDQYCSHIPDKIKLRLYDMEDFKKFDDGKPKVSLLPPHSFDGVAKVLAFGANKYEKDNWKKCNDPLRFYDAAFRHMELDRSGEELDSESGLPHIDHALCDLIMYQWLKNNGVKDEQ